jgi:hypothetical protein
LKRGKMMESLYPFPRRLFWRRMQQKFSKLRQHFFVYLVGELCDRISYTVDPFKTVSHLKTFLTESQK